MRKKYSGTLEDDLYRFNSDPDCIKYPMYIKTYELM